MRNPRYTACTRMYNACERVVEFWDAFVNAVSDLSGVQLKIERHPFPQDIQSLWARPDLGLAFICGRAFALEGMRHKAIAVPLRKGGADGNPAPLYSTHMLVREDAPFQGCEDILSARIGWTVSHSHSGYLAVKDLLAPLAKNTGSLFSQETGPLHTPMNCIKALRENIADAVPMDSFYYDLLLNNAPETLAGTRILATTREYPMPLLAAAPTMDDAVCRALLRGLQEAARLPEMAPVLKALCITGFAEPDIEKYAALLKPGEAAPS